jgi:hypothetical protein
VIVTLEQMSGPGTGRVFEFSGADSFLVGRSKKAHLRLDPKADPLISRTHFLMEMRPPRVIITDLNSRNGTHVNDQRIRQTDLNDGDEIRVGRTVLRVAIVYDPEPEIEPEPEPETATCRMCGTETSDPYESKGRFYCQDCVRRARKAAKTKTKAKTSGLRPKPKPAADTHKPAPPPAAASTSPLIQAPLEEIEYVCMFCDTDLSDRANADGMAAELGYGLYMCNSCVEQQQETNLNIHRLDDYILVSEIGKGGMGVVYKAVHIPTSRLCAIKMVLPELVRSIYATKVFEREVRVQSRVFHPNLVRVLDQGRFQGAPYFVTEFLSGGDIKNLVTWEFQGPVDPRLSCLITLQILDGLEALHDAGYIHRDLKPSNCLLDRSYKEKDFQVKIADYGLAKSYENAGHSVFDYTKEGVMAGSYVFIPPEQITNYKYVKPPVDVYAVGASLYYMLTARYSVDFPGEENGDTPAVGAQRMRHPVEIVLEEPPIPVLKRNPKLPPGLATVVDKAVVKDLKKRFQTAAEFREELAAEARAEGWILE